MRRQAWHRDPVVLAMTALMTYRVTRLLTVDEFPPAEAFRAWLEQRLPADYRHGPTCPHCASWWVALAATAAAQWLGRDRWALVAAPWALSAAAGMIAEREVA